jgi:hypothetical protein
MQLRIVWWADKWRLKIGFLNLFIGNSQEFCLEKLTKIPCGRLVSYVVAIEMMGKASTVNWEGLGRKRCWLVLRTVGVKNSVFLGSLYVSHRVGIIASEFNSLSLAAICFACWHLTDRLPWGQGTRVQSPLVLQASRLMFVTYFLSLKIENGDLWDRHGDLVWFWASPYGVFGVQVGTGTGVSSRLYFFFPFSFITPMLRTRVWLLC